MADWRSICDGLQKIEGDLDYDTWAAAVEAIDMSATASAEERARAELMAVALEDYDRRRHPEDFEGTPIGMLKHLMEANGMSQADLARMLGVARATVSQIVHEQRGISKQVALKLAERFRLDVRVFLG